jgi:hypothetical protein
MLLTERINNKATLSKHIKECVSVKVTATNYKADCFKGNADCCEVLVRNGAWKGDVVFW